MGSGASKEEVPGSNSNYEGSEHERTPSEQSEPGPHPHYDEDIESSVQTRQQPGQQSSLSLIMRLAASQFRSHSEQKETTAAVRKSKTLFRPLVVVRELHPEWDVNKQILPVSEKNQYESPKDYSRNAKHKKKRSLDGQREAKSEVPPIPMTCSPGAVELSPVPPSNALDYAHLHRLHVVPSQPTAAAGLLPAKDEPMLRQNLATCDWVVVAPQRLKQDTTSNAVMHAVRSPPEPREKEEECPICPCNGIPAAYEELDCVPHPDPENIHGSDWLVRCVLNKRRTSENEEFTISDEFPRDGMYTCSTGYGQHELIWETPDHHLTLATMPRGEVEQVIRMYMRRFTELGKNPSNAYTAIFKSHGSYAGASLKHSHSQVVATHVVPNTVRLLLEQAQQYYDRTRECVFCKMFWYELQDKERVIIETRGFVTYAPFASKQPYELHIVPKRHAATFMDLTTEDIAELAHHLKESLLCLYRKLDNPDFTFMFNNAPYTYSKVFSYHWHVVVRPVSNPVGYELATGMAVNVMLPEVCAKQLRDVYLQHRSEVVDSRRPLTPSLLRMPVMEKATVRKTPPRSSFAIGGRLQLAECPSFKSVESGVSSPLPSHGSPSPSTVLRQDFSSRNWVVVAPSRQITKTSSLATIHSQAFCSADPYCSECPFCPTNAKDLQEVLRICHHGGPIVRSYSYLRNSRCRPLDGSLTPAKQRSNSGNAVGESFEEVSTEIRPSPEGLSPGNDGESPMDIDENDWLVRCVLNKYRTFDQFILDPKSKVNKSTELDVDIREIGIYKFVARDSCHHELVLESPVHNTTIALMDLDAVQSILEVYTERFNALKENRMNLLTVIFKNHGSRFCTNVAHPHSQVVALRVMPSELRLSLERAQRYFNDHGGCLYCKMIRHEVQMDSPLNSSKSRVVVESSCFVALIPYAATVPYETHIFPRRHADTIGGLTVEELPDLARILRDVLRRLYGLLQNPDFSYVFRNAPYVHEGSTFYHWHIVITPRMYDRSALEICTSVPINPMLPERCAENLRSYDWRDAAMGSMG